MSQLLLVRTLAPSSLTSLVFAIFSSIERGSSNPRGDTRRWLFFPDAGSKSFQRHPLERVARIPRVPPAGNRPASAAKDREAIHGPECQNPFSCRPGWRRGASLFAIPLKPAFVAIHQSFVARGSWWRTPRIDDRGTVAPLAST